MSISTILEKKQSPWRSLWICNIIQFLYGVQFSIYLTSMWPYLSKLDNSVKVDFFGWVIASYSVGSTFSSFAFGYWNQKTMSVKYPCSFGLVAMSIGNLFYAILPIFKSNHKWIMLAARFIVGIGAGSVGVLRTYCSTASIPSDKTKAISLGIGCFVLGISLGPALQAICTPLGENFRLHGPIALNMYTIPAFAMVLISISAVLILNIAFHEQYAGVICRNSTIGYDFKNIIPKFDRLASMICIALWFSLHYVATTIEAMAVPLTITWYNWTNDESVLFNGIIQFVSALINVAGYFLIGCTRLQRVDKRILILIGVTSFALYHAVNLPFGFYKEKLDYIKLAPNSTIEDTSYSGGCSRRHSWCEDQPRVPFFSYVLSATIFVGIAFPFMSSPICALYSEVLGPRKQGTMQGILEFFASVGRFLGPIISASTFEYSGYLLPMLVPLIMLVIEGISVLLFYNRLVPLRLIPPVGISTKYKSGTFCRL